MIISLGPRFAFPLEPKALAISAPEGVRLDDQERLFPVGDEAGQEEEPEAITAAEVRTLNLTVENEELLAEQGIFSEEFRFALCEIGESRSEEGRIGRCDSATEGLFRQGKEKEQSCLEPRHGMTHRERSLREGLKGHM